MRLADQVNLALSQPKLGPGLDWITEPYRLREVLRKAKHFRLDEKATRYVVDASFAISDHLEEARELARSPYPTIWVQLDNPARIAQCIMHGVALTPMAKEALEKNDLVDHVGWLIERHPTQPTAHRASYFVHLNEGIYMPPLAFTWDCDAKQCPWDMSQELLVRTLRPQIRDFLFGMSGIKCEGTWVTAGWANETSGEWGSRAGRIHVGELAGEMRQIFGFLVTIGHVPTEYREPVVIEGDVSQPPPIVKGKPVFALEHRDIMMRLPKHRDITKVITRVCQGMRKRRHEVRGHWRHWYNDDGSIRRRRWIADHERGDAKLGRVVHDYRVSA